MDRIFLISLVIIAGMAINHINAQVLHTESFSLILDTTKSIKGSIVPDFEFQNQKKDLIEFENVADITFRLKENALTLANKIEMTKYGKEIVLSGGYLYAEYTNVQDKLIGFERFIGIIWSDSRGLEFKYSGGLFTRVRIINNQKMGFYAGAGTFYENERWNYDGVQDNIVPSDAKDVHSEAIKLGSYLSFKWITKYNFSFDCSIYHQSRIKEIFTTPRLASSTSVTYYFTEHFGLLLKYENIYDFAPIVPIEKMFNKVVFSIEISF